MIHIGAMIGAALSQGHSTSLGFTTGLFKRFQNPKDKRDFVTAGMSLEETQSTLEASRKSKDDHVLTRNYTYTSPVGGEQKSGSC